MSNTASTMSVGYGAQELKGIISRNTVRACIGTVVLLLLIWGGITLKRTIEYIWFPPPNVVKVLITRATIDMSGPPPTEEAPPPPPTSAPPQSLSGPAARAGIPVPVPDALIPEDAKDFASVEDMSRASSVGGDGTDQGGWGNGIGDGNGAVNIETREEDPGSDDFVSYEKEATFDYDGLKKSVRYPSQARELGIEGKVNLRVRVGKDGRVDSVIVIDTDNSLLTAEAIRAARATTFTPAIQNGQAVKSWVGIPLVFQLR